ncbi:MAG: oligosaccharide flippase family protein [Patescibacteria group bacterium]|nr:oligosaccharide flippase family protein [Patescibacteria group bacterium]
MIKKIKSFLFENKTTRQTIAKNTFWLFFGEISSRLLRMIIIIYAARVLGADGWGIFSYAITLAAFLRSFSDVGISAILTRESSKNPEMRSRYLSTSLFIKLFLIAISIFLIIFISPSLTKIEQVKPLLPIVALILFFDGMREFGFSLNRSLEKMENEALIKTITNFLIVSLGLVFLIYSKTVKSLAFSYTIGSGIGFLLTIWILRSHFKNLFSNFSKKLMWPIFSAAWPFALMGVLGGIMINTDTLMLGWWRTTEEIGFYSVVQRIIQALYLVPVLFSSSVFPSFSRLANKENEKFRSLLEKSIKLVLLVGIPIILGGIILAGGIITTMFGKEYLPATATFQILLLTILLEFPVIIIGNAVFAYNEQKKFIGFLLIGAIGNVIFNSLLIPRYGIAGSAVATVVAQLLSTGFIWLKMKKINYFTVFPHLLRVFAATIMMGLFVWIIKILGVNIFVNITLSSLIYFGLLYILKEPLLNELKLIFAVSKNNEYI